MDHSKPQAVLFDWDNTLVDTWPTIHAALHKTFNEMGHTPWTLEEVKERVGKSMRDAFPILFGDRWEEAAKSYRTNYRAIHLDRLQPLPDVEPLLQHLRDQDIFTAVVSNKMGDTLRMEVSHLGWDDYFRAIIGATDAPRDKPHPDPIHMALEHAPAKTGETVWFLGDSEVDLQAAKAAGVRAILYGAVTPDPEPANHFRGFPFDGHFNAHDAFLRGLQRL